MSRRLWWKWGQRGSIRRDWAGPRWGTRHSRSEKRQQRGSWVGLQSPVLQKVREWGDPDTAEEQSGEGQTVGGRVKANIPSGAILHLL